jgi:hypothetical protein
LCGGASGRATTVAVARRALAGRHSADSRRSFRARVRAAPQAPGHGAFLEPLAPTVRWVGRRRPPSRGGRNPFPPLAPACTGRAGPPVPRPGRPRLATRRGAGVAPWCGGSRGSDHHTFAVTIGAAGAALSGRFGSVRRPGVGRERRVADETSVRARARAAGRASKARPTWTLELVRGLSTAAKSVASMRLRPPDTLPQRRGCCFPEGARCASTRQEQLTRRQEYR